MSINENEALKKEFNDDVSKNNESLNTFHEIDQNLLLLNSDYKENILYPFNNIEIKLPEFSFYDETEDPTFIQEFNIDGEVNNKCNLNQKQEKPWYRNLSSVLKKTKFHGRNHGA